MPRKKSTAVAIPSRAPRGYAALLGEIKQRVGDARLRASVSVNRELIALYWTIGRDILSRQDQEGWGTRIVDRLAADLSRAFPQMSGFSARNLKYMRSFAEAWPDPEIVQQLVALLPWGHNLRLIEAVKSAEQREWYARQALEHGWSRNRIVVEYALRDSLKPVGVAEYKLSTALPARLRKQLPTAADLEPLREES